MYLGNDEKPSTIVCTCNVVFKLFFVYGNKTTMYLLKGEKRLYTRHKRYITMTNKLKKMKPFL